MLETELGYEKNYWLLVPRLAGVDFRPGAKRLGYEVVNEGAKINFMKRDFIITTEGVKAKDGKASPPNYRSILIHYVLSPGFGDPAKEFLTLAQMPGVMRGGKRPGDSVLNQPLIRAYGDDYEGFARAASKIGGYMVDDQRVWQFRILPRIDMRTVFYEQDDEFPADIQIQFDAGSPQYLEFECLAFLNGCLSQALIEAR